MKRHSIRLATLLACLFGFTAAAQTYTLVTTNSVSGTSGSYEVVYTWTFADTVIDRCQGVTLLGIEPKLTGSVTLPGILFDGTSELAILEIGDGALANSPALTEVTLSTGTLRLGNGVFENCPSLSSVNLGDSLRYIGRRPFANTAIETITLPRSLLNMDGNISIGCLYTLDIDAGDSQFFIASDGCLYNARKTRLYACPPQTSGAITLPDTLTEIMADAFFGCYNVESVTVPATVTKIGSEAFNVSGDWSDYAAPEAEDPRLTSVIYLGTDPSLIAAQDDIYTGAPATLVSYATGSAWQAVGQTWKSRALVVAAPDPDPVGPQSTTGTDGIVWRYEVEDGAAVIGRSLPAVETATTGALTIPAELDGWPVAEIGEKAFVDCALLTSVSIPTSVTKVAASAFVGCTALETFTVTAGNAHYAACYGALYSKDGTTLVKVPACFRFATSVSSVTTVWTNSVIEVINGLLTDPVRIDTTIINQGQTKRTSSTSVCAFEPSVSAANLLAGVTKIADYAFSDCGFLPAETKVNGTVTVSRDGQVISRQTGVGLVMPLGTDCSNETTVATAVSKSGFYCGKVASWKSNVTADTTRSCSVPRPNVGSAACTAKAWYGSFWENEPETATAVSTSGVFAYVGIAQTIDTGITSATATKVTASGLPSGLKLVKSVDKATGLTSWLIQGTASKAASKIVTLKATLTNRKAVATTLAVTVAAAPNWLAGDYNGGVFDSASAIGQATATITAAGKLSGKIKLPNETGTKEATWTVAMAGFESYDADSGVYQGTATLKSGRNRRDVTVTCSEAADGTGHLVLDLGDGTLAELFQNIWKRRDLVAPTYVKGRQVVRGSLTFKYQSSGKVKWSGKILGDNGKLLSVSGTAQLLNDSETILLYIPPKKTLVGGLAELISLDESGCD